MNVNDLYETIWELPQLNNKQALRNTLLIYIMFPLYGDLSEDFDTLVQEHNKLKGKNYRIITYKGRRHKTSRSVGELGELHPSLNMRMGHYQRRYGETATLTHRMKNYLTSAINMSSNLHDLNALLPAEFFPALTQQVDTHCFEMLAYCVKPHPILKQARIDQFLEMHENIYASLRTIKLDRLTK